MRMFFMKVAALILSFAIAFCFISYLTTDIATNNSMSNDQDPNSFMTGSKNATVEVQKETLDESIEAIQTVVKDSDINSSDTFAVAIQDVSVDEKNTENNGSFWVEFIDVGQGDSALIQCDGHYMLIDGGPSSASSIIYTILRNSGIDSIDYMIATHPDADHIGGLSGALNYATVEVCYSPEISHDTKTFESLVKYLNKQNVSITVPTVGTAFQLGRATVEILGPIEKSLDTNNNSIVTRVTFGNTCFLFMGDAEIEEEHSLIEAGVELPCDVLKAGHHGSDSSMSDEFLNKAAPKYVIFSVGAENSYGHPAEEVLAKLKALDLSLYRTDIQGDIFCESDGKVISFSTEKKASEEALWIAGPSSSSTVTRDGIVVSSPEKSEIPEGTTYVLNTSSRKFHLPTCASVDDMSERNRIYSTDSADKLIAVGYKPCGRCNPSDAYIHEGDSQVDQGFSDVDRKSQNNGEENSYVLNTKTLKFHRLDCSSVTEMNANNRKDVTMSREEMINQGYTPCKRCNP